MGDGYVAVPVGDNAGHLLIRLNESGADICKALSDGNEKADIISMLVNKYDGLDAKTADEAAEKVISILRSKNLLED